MPFLATDITLVLSGGSTNSDPSQSLGGDPSSVTIVDGIDNLFDDISESDAALGKTDYRCFYIFNDNGVDSFYDVRLWIDSQTPLGSVVSLGIVFADDTQVITVIGLPTGGSFTIATGSYEVVANFNSVLSVWGMNIQNAINSIPGITGAVVSSASFPGNIFTFQVSFQGNNSNRYQSLMSIAANNLTGGSIQVLTNKLVDGSPINSIALSVDQSTTPPPGVTFFTSAANNPIVVGDMQPADGFPVWVQRVTVAGTGSVADDIFTLKIKGDLIR